MAKLTETRLKGAKDILERYRDELFQLRSFDVRAIEGDLKTFLNTGYRGIKPFMVDLSEHGRYQEVAAYYMEHSNGGVSRTSAEFKPCLARLYGITSFNNAKDFKQQRDRFWAQAFNDAVDV